MVGQAMPVQLESSRILSWTELEAGGIDGAAAVAFCEQMHSCGYSVIRMPDGIAAEIATLREEADGFFAMPANIKREVGDFRRVADTYVGYRDCAECDSEFLELHVTRRGGVAPDHRVAPALAVASVAMHTRMAAMARVLLTFLAAGLDLPPEAFLDPLDPPCSHDLPEDGLSSSVLRLCHYRPCEALADEARRAFSHHPAILAACSIADLVSMVAPPHLRHSRMKSSSMSTLTHLF